MWRVQKVLVQLEALVFVKMHFEPLCISTRRVTENSNSLSFSMTVRLVFKLLTGSLYSNPTQSRRLYWLPKNADYIRISSQLMSQIWRRQGKNKERSASLNVNLTRYLLNNVNTTIWIIQHNNNQHRTDYLEQGWIYFYYINGHLLCYLIVCWKAACIHVCFSLTCRAAFCCAAMCCCSALSLNSFRLGLDREMLQDKREDRASRKMKESF